ncbi:von Willebrand factor-like isoform X2 [Leguminivora glycinivorella]|uniref:von Willebrand factor-like isoform X2 n=1 Tax=Leguminivora glycinivorella TaxID=1035111 RepID=UPI00200E9187|nr:von Willebrand factor-like isoform X2 [Leguminivora glycinivorella]
MKLIFFITIVAVAVWACNASCYKKKVPPSPCPKGEVRNTCGSACPPTCENKDEPPICTSQCVDGCFCAKGTYRNKKGKCTADCSPPIKCKANEVYNPCRITCPPQTCDSTYTTYDCRNATKCEPGCDCISEYLRNGTAKDLCIPSRLCPPPCPKGEYHDTCGTACPITCKNIENPPKTCTRQCVDACYCNRGTYRNKKGKCVKDCSKDA